MSDYISKTKLLEEVAKYKFGAISNDAEREYTKEMVLLIASEQPTLDEKEIIRKPFERVLERLEEEIELVVTQFPLQGKYIKKSRAIKIVKEECGINE